MEITKEEFKRYEEVRIGGRTNMFTIINVSILSGLNRKKVKYIINHRDELMKKYPDIRI